jgi:hypothetical protein
MKKRIKMKMNKIAIAAIAVLVFAGCQSDVPVPSQATGNDQVCDESGRVYSSERAAQRAGLAPAQYGATYCEQRNTEPQDKVCDQFGNVYNSETMAQRAGLSPAQYGATYCK